jgi:hypothetical protein
MTRMSFNEYDSVSKALESHPDRAGFLEVEYMYHAAHAGVNDSGLSDRDRGILEFERQWWKYSGAKEEAIRELFDVSATRYYQLINNLIDTPEALEYDPMLVKRLRRMRASRQQARTANRVSS